MLPTSPEARLTAGDAPGNGQAGSPPTSAQTDGVQRTLAEALRLQGTAQASALRRSIVLAQEAVRLARLASNRGQEAAALHTLARSRYLLGDLQGAVGDYGAALAIRVAAGDRAGEAATRAYLASAYYALGQPARALEESRRAAELAASVGDRPLEAYATNGVGNAHQLLGAPHDALAVYERALGLWRTAGDLEGEGIVLSNLAVLHESFGEQQIALRMYLDALTRMRAVRQPRREAALLHNIGMTYLGLGRPEQAVAFLERALTLERETGDRRSEAQTRLYLAEARLRNGALPAASREYGSALTLARQIGDRDAEGDALRGRGQFAAASGQHEEAIRLVRSAQELHRAVGNVRGQAGDLLALGTSLDALGRADEALRTYEEALQLTVAAQDRISEAETRFRMARAHGNRHELAEASTWVETAIGRVEYFATVQGYYRWYIDLLMRRHREDPSAGFDIQALAIFERSRARGLLDLLNEAGADILADIPPALAERHRHLRQMLSFNAARRAGLPAGSGEERAHLDREIASLLADYQTTEAEIKATSARYASLAEPLPLQYAQMQALLDGDTTLLIYVMGEERAYAWVLTASTISVRELSDFKTIASLAESAQRALVARPFDPVNRAAPIPSLAPLTAAVLEPVAPLLGTRRLAIVADGPLEYVPIGALPSPASLPGSTRAGASEPLDAGSEPLPILGREGSPYRPLIADREVAYLPSASTLGRLREDAARRAHGMPSVAILADPVFADDDPRVRQRHADSRAPARAVSRRATASSVAVATSPTREPSSDTNVLPRLPSTRREAEAIAAIAGASTRLLLDFEATRERAMDPMLREYSLVHFATHALIDDRYPELAGIALSRITKDGQPQDGFLRLEDIYTLRLSADMVVLSACRTALGPEIRGEGLVGLVRGFMSAGARRVVASLWTVEDAATAELMTAFYTGLLRDGLPPAIALQRAQRHMWQQPRWRAPFYWAAFVLQGDWT
jgi:tetratricopeptide (TPR) repeat protein